MQYFGTARFGAIQNVSYTGTAGASSGITASVNRVRLLATTDCYVLITKAGTLATTTTGFYLVGLIPEYITVNPGEIISAIQVSSNGSLNIAECA